MRKFLFAACSIFFITTAHAQHMNAADSPCNKHVVTVELSRCFADENKRQDLELNQLYQRVLKKLDEGNDAENLRKAQRLWVQYRDAACHAEYEMYGGGTGGPPTHLACLESLTRERVKQLHTTYDWIFDK